MRQLDSISSNSSTVEATCVKEPIGAKETSSLYVPLSLLDDSSLTLEQNANKADNARKSWKQPLQSAQCKKSIRFELLDYVFMAYEDDWDHASDDGGSRNIRKSAARLPKKTLQQIDDPESLWYTSSKIRQFQRRSEQTLQGILQCPYKSLVIQVLSTIYNEEDLRLDIPSSSKAVTALARSYAIGSSSTKARRINNSDDLWGLEQPIARFMTRKHKVTEKIESQSTTTFNYQHSPEAAAMFAYQVALAQQKYVESNK